MSVHLKIAAAAPERDARDLGVAGILRAGPARGETSG